MSLLSSLHDSFYHFFSVRVVIEIESLRLSHELSQSVRVERERERERESQSDFAFPGLDW